MVAEMIHTASLIHDDIIDDADTRRGRPSINRIWGEKKALLTGNFIVAQASHALACMDNSHVIELLSSVAEDIVHGKFLWAKLQLIFWKMYWSIVSVSRYSNA